MLASWLRKLRILTSKPPHCHGSDTAPARAHSHSTLIFVGAVFALAGLAKGIIGLGLPTISMGLLATVMSPVHAAAILLLPSLVTNVWQMIAGPTPQRYCCLVYT
jgi:uncharacterized protein